MHNDNHSTVAQEIKRLRALYGADLPRGEPEQRVAWLKRWITEYAESYADWAACGDVDAIEAQAAVTAAGYEMATSAGLDVGAGDAACRQVWRLACTHAGERLDGLEKRIFWAAKRNTPLAQILNLAEMEATRSGSAWTSKQLKEIVARILGSVPNGARRGR
jgi:hypothetical protein